MSASGSVSHTLTEEILAIIEAGVDADLSDERFNDYCMKLFTLQYETNAIFREFCDVKKVRPGDITRWQDVPMVYNDVFKTHLVASFPLEQSVMACLTGGTTSLTQRGRIFRDEDGKKLVFGANKMMTNSYLFPDFEEGKRCRILILAPSPEMAPSMGMAIGMDQTRKAFGTPDSMFLLGKSGIDIKNLLKALRESEASGVPVALIGATAAYVYFFQACRRRKISFKLPAGSRVCDGGGYRGRFGVVTRDDYYDMVQEILDVPRTHCVNVLGEAETATNLFDDALRRHVKGLPEKKLARPVPPWSRVLAMNIDDLSPLPDGEVGLLAHWDLANVPTVLAVITDNLGYTTDNGKSCEMVGRAKIENGKVSPLPDEERTMGPMGDSAIFRMLETYTNFSIDLKMRLAKDPKVAPSPREEIEARPGSVASCPQVVDEILVSQADKEAAEQRDLALGTFKDQTERPLDWFLAEAEKQKLMDHPAGLKSEKPAPAKKPQ
ncbi:acyl-protein synthetase [Citrifermentans bemidjiense Bem]|uniref:Acyl-protein synthetase n=1 Tax=Citrifermentans bemidjiense (strain ATCC BAA-1014 / DSM 16622 / JCM 12645 / Bem) TaxID=404380 RepID=B5EHH3_CITBB|nr:acyl-protein synthetase [Citrifermentans bemidjiense]ACH38183.1 acyl-protein synthetase [Citrifermentans bemidjiense Bem]